MNFTSHRVPHESWYVVDEPFLSWWMIVLVGMWSIALTIWQCRSFHREIRQWSGLLACIYLILMFVAFGALSPHFGQLLFGQSLTVLGQVLVNSIVFIWMLGPINCHGRRICYAFLLLGNASICEVAGATEIALGLTAAALLSFASLIQTWRRTGAVSLPDWLFQQMKLNWDSPHDLTQPGKYWLIGLATAVLTFVLLGTVSYAIRVESSRTNSSPRYSALPSRELLSQTHPLETDSPRLSAVMEYTFGQRPEIIVLTGAILFLGLASSLHHARTREVAPGENFSQQ